jgi:N,N-dimethylformamidase
VFAGVEGDLAGDDGLVMGGAAGDEGGAASSDVRADMTLHRLSGGGAVFAVGSISSIAPLPSRGYDNNVSRVAENVARGWLSGDGDAEPRR